jgi:diguanylate cyclase (GGDEF)-like protein
MRQVKTPSNVKGGTPLTRALDQSYGLRNKLERCAGELASLVTVLEQEIAQHLPIGRIEYALDRSEEIGSKVEEAAVDLSAMSRDLERGIKERQNLEGRLSRIKTRGKKVRQLAFHDQVTGLPNRTLFNDRLDHALAQAERHAWNVVVMFIDLDKFKPVNDRYGHDVGDRALQMVAQRLQGLVRAVDTVSRYGGDEFLCMMSEIEDREDIATVAQKVLSNIAVPYEIDGLKIMVSSSIGIAIYPSNGETAEVLLKKADAAMYRAKQNHSGYLFAEDESALGKVAAPPHRVAESSKRKTQKSGLTAVPDNTAIKKLGKHWQSLER